MFLCASTSICASATPILIKLCAMWTDKKGNNKKWWSKNGLHWAIGKWFISNWLLQYWTKKLLLLLDVNKRFFLLNFRLFSWIYHIPWCLWVAIICLLSAHISCFQSLFFFRHSGVFLLCRSFPQEWKDIQKYHKNIGRISRIRKNSKI